MCALGQNPKGALTSNHNILLASAIATSCLLVPDAAVAGESISPEVADAFQSWLVRSCRPTPVQCHIFASGV